MELPPVPGVFAVTVTVALVPPPFEAVTTLLGGLLRLIAETRFVASLTAPPPTWKFDPVLLAVFPLFPPDTVMLPALPLAAVNVKLPPAPTPFEVRETTLVAWVEVALALATVPLP